MEDSNALLQHLNLKQVKVLGWSDGGILGLLLAIHHPDKVSRLAVMGANLVPEAAYPWALDGIKTTVAKITAMKQSGDRSQDWDLQLQLLDLLGNQPHIPVSDLKRIQAPLWSWRETVMSFATNTRYKYSMASHSHNWRSAMV